MSQWTNTSSVSTLGDLVFENYVGKVKPHLEVMSPLLALFNKAGPGEYELTGKELRFAGDLTYAQPAMATTGELPDHADADPVQFVTTPKQIYIRRAIRHFTAARAQGAGTFENYAGRIVRQLWDGMERAQIRHVNGSSNGFICLVNARTSATVFTVKDGYGYTGTDPLMHLEPGMLIGWLDASNSYAVGGHGVISSINYSTKTITMSASFENGAGTPTIASGDALVFITTNDDGASYFASEYGNAPNGLIDLIDPADAASTYLGVSEATYPRVQPVRRASSNFGEIEFMEWAKEMQSKGMSQVTSSSHVFSTSPGVVIELAKTLIPYTQIQQKGRSLDGGWTTVSVGGFEFVEDPFHIHNAIVGWCVEDMKVVDLDGDPKMYSGDGSEWARLADFDGSEAFARHYVQRFLDRRNRSGALTGIAGVDADRYSASPNYS